MKKYKTIILLIIVLIELIILCCYATGCGVNNANTTTNESSYYV